MFGMRLVHLIKPMNFDQLHQAQKPCAQANRQGNYFKPCYWQRLYCPLHGRNIPFTLWQVNPNRPRNRRFGLPPKTGVTETL